MITIRRRAPQNAAGDSIGKNRNWTAALVGIGALAVTVGLWQLTVADRDLGARQKAMFTAETAAADFSLEMQRRAAHLLGLLRSGAVAGDRAAVRAAVHAHMEHTSGFLGIARVSGDGRVEWVEPEAGNEFLPGTDLTSDPALRAALDRVSRGAGQAIAFVRHLPSAGGGLVIVAPNLHPDGGFFVSFFDLHEVLIGTLGMYITQLYSIGFYQGETLVHRHAAEPLAARAAHWTGSAPVPALGPGWSLRLTPLFRPPEETLTLDAAILLALGLALALALAAAVRFAGASGDRRRAIAEVRREYEAEAAGHCETRMKLEETESRFDAFFDGAPSGFGIVTDELKYLRINEPLAAVNGKSVEEHIGKSLYEIAPQIVPLVQPLIHSVLATGEPVRNAELTVDSPSRPGVTRNWLCSLFPISSAEDGSIIFGTVVNEITEQKRIEAALRESEERFAAILATAVDAIITLDDAGQVLTANPAADRLFGYEQNDLVGRCVSSLMPELFIGLHDGNIAHYLANESGSLIGVLKEVDGQKKNGAVFPAEIAMSEVCSGAERVFTVFVRDNTERRKIDRMKNEFISTVSHELRTPLTSIVGSLGLIAGGAFGEIDDKSKELLCIALSNSERLVRLINEILDIEKIESGNTEFNLRPVDLAIVTEQTIVANEAYGERFGVKFVFDNRAGEAIVMADGDRVIQVVTNLLSNAAKFSPEGAAVTVTITRHAGRLRVAVRDRGPGIPDEFRSTIFQKFAQADSSDTRAKGGTGLGLSIVKAIVEEHGGEIGFDTEAGQGTTFYFYLPEISEADRAATEAGRERPMQAAE